MIDGRVADRGTVVPSGSLTIDGPFAGSSIGFLTQPVNGQGGNDALNVDDTGNTFAGTLMGRYKVFVDPYAPVGASSEYFIVGYKGTSPYDAGLFYCPYVPLQMYRAVDPNSFVPKIGFKTRYALVSNPFSKGTAGQSNGSIEADVNQYYRKVKVSNLF